MREYKFRGKRVDNGEWVHGNLIEWNNRAFIHFGELRSKNKWREVTPETVSQYTGIKDRNGVEIYEGDILNLWRSVGEKGELRGNYYTNIPVEYCDLWCQFVVVDKANKEQFGIWENFGAFEVIGNIHDKEAKEDDK